ncbi:hypothetical protein [Neobacillus dielmonensis]|uniref:hypothetical protein n=1 Tax=Neobacillus dielmonensis TaxID=1347369 RepID=UPI0005A845DF|nr:hypothetical protein [Neobacillus dielmonensis]
MFKLTVYKKVHFSRNFILILLVLMLVLVGGKIILAHEKLSVFEEAMNLFQKGDLVAAEKMFRAAKLNVAVTDHNKEINEKLSILSPIREKMEDWDEKAADDYDHENLEELVVIYEEWQNNQKKWLGASPVKKDMYQEMLALTGLDKDLQSYFSKIKSKEIASLKNKDNEETIYNKLNKIPAEYYGGKFAKTNEIKDIFLKYYQDQLNQLITADESLIDLVSEANRQFGMLSSFSIDSEWLVSTLDEYLLKVLKTSMEAKDYAAFAEQANSIKKLSAKMDESNVIVYIEKTKNELLSNAKKLAEVNKYEDAVKLYEDLKPLEDTEQLIADTNLAWDRYEPIRVLQRLYPDKEFPQFVNVRNKWGADSAVAAVAADGSVYFGKLTGEQDMTVSNGTLPSGTTVNKLDLKNSFTGSDVPMIFVDAKSTTRKHRYMAYEVKGNTLDQILNVEADNLTAEPDGMLLVDNPVGQGEGELAYYEPDYYGQFRFSKIKVDYIDINVQNITQYYGQKVRFNASIETNSSKGPLVKISQTYNYATYQPEISYLLLKGASQINSYYSSYFIGTFNSYDTITTDTGETVQVPVFQVEKVE